MTEFLRNLFATDRFMPHGHCYLWNPGLVWTHVISDSLIAAAYLAISLTLVYLVHQARREIPFERPVVDYMLDEYYRPNKIPLRGCQPRDLITAVYQSASPRTTRKSCPVYLACPPKT